MATARRYSRQRELIYQCVQGTKQHPTAEMVYEWLRPENPNLSLGTVYRNLKLLSSEGQLKQMPLNVERYDAGLQPHAHFKCGKCGQVSDLDGDCMEVLAAFGKKNPGYRFDDVTLIFDGLCPGCASQARDN